MFNLNIEHLFTVIIVTVHCKTSGQIPYRYNSSERPTTQYISVRRGNFGSPLVSYSVSFISFRSIIINNEIRSSYAKVSAQLMLR
jgi:hypothetical protein